MTHIPKFEVPSHIVKVLNNLFEIERKLTLHGDHGSISRNVEKIKDAIRDTGYFYEDPTGQAFRETRTDLEATISGDRIENLYVSEVMKPIIRCGLHELSMVVQKGIVVVQANEGKAEA
jgi:hypothetical protein